MISATPSCVSFFGAATNDLSLDNCTPRYKFVKDTETAEGLMVQSIHARLEFLKNALTELSLRRAVLKHI